MEPDSFLNPVNKNPAWSIRDFHVEDMASLSQLRRICLSGSRECLWFKWIYQNGPHGPSISQLAVTGDQIIGQCALLPLRYKLMDTYVSGSIAFDAMTHPDHRQQGVFSDLARSAYRLSAEKGIRFSCGNPGNGAVKNHIENLQWIEVCKPPLLMKVVRWDAILRKHIKLPIVLGRLVNKLAFIFEKSYHVSQQIRFEYIEKFDDSIDDFWEKASGINKILIEKNKEYLNWRYCENPLKKYHVVLAKKNDEIVGFTVIDLQQIPSMRAFIIDILTLPDVEIGQALIREAISFSRKNNADTLLCTMLENTQYYDILRKMGFHKRKSDFRLCIRLYDERIPRNIILDPSNWYYVRGDSDSI